MAQIICIVVSIISPLGLHLSSTVYPLYYISLLMLCILVSTKLFFFLFISYIGYYFFIFSNGVNKFNSSIQTIKYNSSKYSLLYPKCFFFTYRENYFFVHSSKRKTPALENIGQCFCLFKIFVVDNYSSILLKRIPSL